MSDAKTLMIATEAANAIRRLRARLDWLEGTSIPHTRKQENANGGNNILDGGIALHSAGQAGVIWLGLVLFCFGLVSAVVFVIGVYSAHAKIVQGVVEFSRETSVSPMRLVSAVRVLDVKPQKEPPSVVQVLDGSGGIRDDGWGNRLSSLSRRYDGMCLGLVEALYGLPLWSHWSGVGKIPMPPCVDVSGRRVTGICVDACDVYGVRDPVFLCQLSRQSSAIRIGLVSRRLLVQFAATQNQPRPLIALSESDRARGGVSRVSRGASAERGRRGLISGRASGSEGSIGRLVSNEHGNSGNEKTEQADNNQPAVQCDLPVFKRPIVLAVLGLAFVLLGLLAFYLLDPALEKYGVSLSWQIIILVAIIGAAHLFIFLLFDWLNGV